MNLAPFSTRTRHHGQQHAPEPAHAAATRAFHFHTVIWEADGFGFDSTSGEFFTASPTALVVMQALSVGMSRPQILDRLTASFEVTRSTAERDLESFLAQLAHIGLTQEFV